MYLNQFKYTTGTSKAHGSNSDKNKFIMKHQQIKLTNYNDNEVC